MTEQIKDITKNITIAETKCDNVHCEDGVVGVIWGEKIHCGNCEDKWLLIESESSKNI